MNFDFKTEKKENSQMLLTITFPKEEIRVNYDEKLKEIQKEIVMKGFRKGKAPISLIEAKYKDAILGEVGEFLLEEAFKEIFDKLEKKPYSMPVLKDTNNLELDKDYCVELVYDIYPEFEYENYNNIEIERDEVAISKEDIELEIEGILKENATLELTDDAIQEEDLVYLKYVVTENGKEIERNDGSHVLVKKTDNISSNLIGLKKGDKKKIIESKDSDSNKDEQGKKEIDVEILEVKRKVLPKLTDEFVKELDDSCKNVKEFKEQIQKRLEGYVEEYIEKTSIDKIFEKLIESFKGEIPESMIQNNIENIYNRMLEVERKNEKLLFKKVGVKNREEFNEKMRDKAINEIKSLLILNDLINKEKIEVSEDDLIKYIENIKKFKKYFQKIDTSSFLENLKKSKEIEDVKREIQIEKLYKKMLDSIKIKKGKKIKIRRYF